MKKKIKIIEILLVAVFIVSLILICPDLLGRVQAIAQNNEIQQSSPATAPDKTDTTQTMISELNKINSDIIGWIYIDGTNIDYPILQGSNNDYYLNHLYDNTSNSAGSIFLDYSNNSMFDDQNSVIYGHSRYDGTMFSELRKLKVQSFVNEHPYITIYTKENTLQYKIISVNVVPDTFDFCQKDIGNKLETYIESMKQSSYIRNDETVSDQDRIITLSTCTDVIENGRLIIIAKLMD